MLRALVTFFVTTFLAIVLGTSIMLASLVYPARWPMTWGSYLWSRVILATAGVRLTVEGLEQLIEGTSCFFAGNHQSALDIPILVTALRGRVRFLAKASLFRIPVFGWAISRCEHIPIHRSRPRATIRRLTGMIDRLRRRPMSFVVFPEGTRSPDGRLLPFRMGAMKICQRAGLSVVPFSIDGSFTVHERARFRIRPGPVRLVFAKPIPAGEVTAMTAAELHERVRQAIASGLGQPGAAGADDATLIPAERT